MEFDLSKLKILDFWAEWCKSCLTMEPILEEVCKELDVRLIKIDVDSDEDMVITYGIRNIPTLVFIKDDKIVEKISGTISKDKLIEKIKQYE